MRCQNMSRKRTLGCALILFICIYFYISLRSTHVPLKAHTDIDTAFKGTGNDQTTNNKDSLKRSGMQNHVILVFNPKPWYNFHTSNKTLKEKCSYRNCILTFDKSDLVRPSAIFFDGNNPEPNLLQWDPPIPPSRRNQDQAWIISLMEHPTCHNNDRFGRYKFDQWRYTFNWTWSYTSDSDIPTPLGYVRRRDNPERKNYSAIFHRKTKMAAWVVSHCKTSSKREIYVKKLQEYGVDVDIYGECSGKRINEKEKERLIHTEYKFYLSFENSFCKEYVTEKFFKYYKLDVVLVVRGGTDYKSLVSRDAVINTADFDYVEDLAKYMKKVAASETLYVEYLRNKDKFQSFVRGQEDSFCQVCNKLNNLDTNRKVYTNLVDKINNGTCFNPDNIL